MGELKKIMLNGDKVKFIPNADESLLIAKQENITFIFKTR